MPTRIVHTPQGKSRENYTPRSHTDIDAATTLDELKTVLKRYIVSD